VKRTVVEKATEDQERRHELFEATLRVLDGHPDAAASVFGAFAKDATASALDGAPRLLVPGEEGRSDR
jgi:hypothetical protein